MANKPRRRSLRDRICAMLGIRRQPRLISIFTEDLPQDHMQWMEEPQYLSYVQSLDSQQESVVTPSTSKSSKEYSQLGPQAGTRSTDHLHKSSSVMSLHHWTSTAMSPLELFYCATVAPYDVDRASDSQAFPAERPGRACCDRRMDATTFSLHGIQSDLACPSRYLVPFGHSTRAHVNDLPNKIAQSQHDITFLESAEACFRKSANKTKRSANESYWVPGSKEKAHDLGDVETRSAAESASHKGTARLYAMKDVCPESNRCQERREDSDVAIRLCDNQVALTLKESCKHVIITFKNAIKKNDNQVDCSNAVRRELGNTDELIRTNKDTVTISIAGDCVFISMHIDRGERLSSDGAQCGRHSIPSSEVCHAQYTDQRPNKKPDDGNDGCVNTSKEVQTGTVDSDGTGITSIVFSLRQVLATAEPTETGAEGGDLSLQTGRSQVGLVDEHKNASVANGAVANGVANGVVASGVVVNGVVPNRVVANGVVANGVVANGVVANGVVASGVVVNGVVPNRVVANGVVPNGVVANGVAKEVVANGVANGVVANGVVANGVVANGVVVNGRASAKNTRITHTDCCDQLEIETGNSKKKYDDDNEEQDDLYEGSLGDVIAGCQDNFDSGQCSPIVPSEGASADGATDKRSSNEVVVGNVMKREDVIVSVRQVPDVGRGTSNIGTVQYHQGMNHNKDKQGEISLVDTRTFSFVDETGMVDAFLLLQVHNWSSQLSISTVSSYRPGHRMIGRLQRDLQQLDRELEECRGQLGHVNTCLSALRQEVTGARFALTTVCHLTAMSNGESSYLRTLEPTCYKKYQHIHSRAEAKYTRNIIRTHIKALNDLEVLIYRKHLVLLQVLSCGHQEQVPQAKRGSICTHKALKAKRREQTESSQEPMDRVIIEIVSVAAGNNSSSNETASIDSPANISTLLSISSEGGPSQYLTDTEN